MALRSGNEGSLRRWSPIGTGRLGEDAKLLTAALTQFGQSAILVISRSGVQIPHAALFMLQLVR